MTGLDGPVVVAAVWGVAWIVKNRKQVRSFYRHRFAQFTPYLDCVNLSWSLCFCCF